jgi:hypothetical protein
METRCFYGVSPAVTITPIAKGYLTEVRVERYGVVP